VYWQAGNAQWYGPLGVGAAGSTFSAPSAAQGNAGFPVLAAQGPGNTLYVYWQAGNAQWYGPLGVGPAGSTFSAPSIAGVMGVPADNDADIDANPFPTVAAQGPNHSLYVYWEAANGQWYGPLGAGAAGSTYSAPSVASGPSGLPTVAVLGPSNSLWVYWEASNAQWYGPLGVAGQRTTQSAPQVSIASDNLPTVAAQTPNGSLYVYWMVHAVWYGPLGVGAAGSTFGPPGIQTG
jgi:hypothetical protein